VLPRSARHPTTTACPWTSFNRRPQPCRQWNPNSSHTPSTQDRRGRAGQLTDSVLACNNGHRGFASRAEAEPLCGGMKIRCRRVRPPVTELGGPRPVRVRTGSQRCSGAVQGPQGQARIDKDRTGLTSINASDLGKRHGSALIGKGRQDPQRTHNPSAVGSSPTRPTVDSCDLRKRLIWGANSGRWSTGLNPVLVSSTPLPSPLVEVTLTCADVSAHGWRMASWVGCASVWTSNSGRWLDARIRKWCRPVTPGCRETAQATVD